MLHGKEWRYPKNYDDFFLIAEYQKNFYRVPSKLILVEGREGEGEWGGGGQQEAGDLSVTLALRNMTVNVCFGLDQTFFSFLFPSGLRGSRLTTVQYWEL